MIDSNAHDELEELGELVRTHAEADLNAGLQARSARERFLAHADRQSFPQAQRFRWWLWAVPAAAAAAGGLYAFRMRSLTWDVSGAPRDGAYVRASSDHVATLTFSDETTVVANANSRLRVEDVTLRGARVLVERGQVNVHVVHHSASAWTFAAGPFEVLVTGTRFAIEWDPAREICELSMLDGSVEVRGPTGAGPVSLRAGQHFHGEAQRGSMLVSRSTAPAPPASVNRDPEPVPDAGAADGNGVLAAGALAMDASSDSASVAIRAHRAPSSSEPSPAENFQELIARGKFAQIVTLAEQRGLDNCLASCGSADLRALSDAARYTGRVELAQRSLIAIRKRFAGRAKSDATFLLGRLEEQRVAFVAAERWYDTYLGEASSGEFAAEALAGKMRTVRALRGERAAVPIAEEYLRRFSSGVHVKTAREILRGN